MIESDMAEKLWEKLENILVDNNKAFISVTGGGGKTTFLVSFSQYLKNKGYSVLVTTSTKLASPYAFDYKADKIFLSSSILSYWPGKGECVFYSAFDEKLMKAVAPPEKIVSLLFNRYDVVIVEADGSRRLPIKIHSERDPVIWDNTTAVVAISGLWAYGKRVCDTVFGDNRESLIVDKDYYSYLVSTPQGMAKGMGENTKNVFLFNGGDAVDHNAFFNIKTLSLPSLGLIVSLKEDIIYESF